MTCQGEKNKSMYTLWVVSGDRSSGNANDTEFIFQFGPEMLPGDLRLLLREVGGVQMESPHTYFLTARAANQVYPCGHITVPVKHMNARV